MPIEFARARYISRTHGGNAVRSSAYNSRKTLFDVRLNHWFHFGHRDEPEYHNILLPEDAPANWGEAGVLWNEVERREDRSTRPANAQVAREIVLALPNEIADLDHLTYDEQIDHMRALAESFARRHFVSQGLAVQIDIHEPHTSQIDSDEDNWHAHLLITTRRIGRDGLAATRARDLDPTVRRFGNRAHVTEGDLWGALWAEHQQEYFNEHELEIEIDPPRIVPQPHLGPRRTWDDDGDAVATIAANHEENFVAAHDPARVLDALTRRNPTFSERDLDRCLEHNLRRAGAGENAVADENTVAEVRRGVLALSEELFDRTTGESSGRFTRESVRVAERAAADEAQRLVAAEDAGPIDEAHIQEALDDRTLRQDEIDAVRRATGSDRLILIGARGRNGANSALSAIGDAHRLGGYQVVGLGANIASASAMAEEGFLDPGTDPRTVREALAVLDARRETWNRPTLLIVDGAGQLEPDVLREMLARANQTGARVLLLCDEPTGTARGGQNAGGGLAAELARRYGSIRIERIDGQAEALDAAVHERRAASIRWATASDILEPQAPAAAPGPAPQPALPGGGRVTRATVTRVREQVLERAREQDITANREQFRERYWAHQARETLGEWARLMAQYRATHGTAEGAAARERLVGVLRALQARRENMMGLADANAGPLTNEERQRLSRLLRGQDPARTVDELLAEEVPVAGPSAQRPVPRSMRPPAGGAQTAAGPSGTSSHPPGQNRPDAQEIAAGRQGVYQRLALRHAREALDGWAALMTEYRAAPAGPAAAAVRDRIEELLRMLQTRRENLDRLADGTVASPLTDQDRQRLARLMRQRDPVRAADELIVEETGAPPPPRAVAGATVDVDMGDAGDGPSNTQKRQREEDSGDEDENSAAGPSRKRGRPEGRE